MDNKVITYKNLTALPGEKAQGFVPVHDAVSLPVTVINGAKPGKTLLITAGIHGGEYPGILTATRLAKDLDPADIQGQVVIINCVNIAAFYSRTSYISPLDGKNLNRLFPGDKNGTRGDKTAYFLTEYFQKKADFYLDLHGGDIHEKLPPYVYCPGVGDDKEALDKALQAAKLINAEYMVISSSTTGAYNSRAILGIPSLLIERGGNGLWSKEEVERYTEDVLNIMAHLGMLNREVKSPAKPAKVITKAEYVDADVSGCWFPMADIRQKIKQGEKIGYITDIFGNVIKEYFAEYDAEILYVATSLAITSGTAIITYGA